LSPSPMEETQLGAAKNQALFREINERLRELKSGAEEHAGFTCECADVVCLQTIDLTLVEYEAVRSSPTRFAVVADERHVVPEAERVVERTDRYWVVEKIDAAAKLATALKRRGA
jgi:hypothetical protein